MTSSITPNPGIHNMPALDSGAWTLPDWAQLQAWGNTLVTQIEQAIAFALLNVSVLGVKPFVALQTFGTETLGAVSQLEQLIAGIGGAAMADVVALLNEIQQLIDALANGFGLPGTGHTVPDIQAYLAGQAAFVSDWVSALAEAGVSAPVQFVQLLRGLIPAAIPQFNGTWAPTGVPGFIDNLNGTISFVVGEAQTDVAQLIQQADGTIITASQVVQHVANGASQAGAAVGQAVAAGQAVADGIVQAAAADATLVAQAAGTAQANLATLFNNFAIHLGFGSLPGQGGTNIALAGTAAGIASAQAQANAVAAALNTSGTVGGTDVTVDFSTFANAPTLAGITTPGTGPIGITSGEMAWQGTGVGDYAEKFPTATASDYQVIEVTLGSLNDLAAGLVHFEIQGRKNASADTLVEVLVHHFVGSYEVTLYARVNGTSYHLYTVTMPSLSSGGVFKLILGDKAAGNPYIMELLYNNSVVIGPYSDSGHVSQIGSGNRFVAVQQDVDLDAPGNKPPGIRKIRYYDNAPSTGSTPFSGLPASNPSIPGGLYFCSDTGLVLRDNGGGWDRVQGGPLTAFTAPPTSFTNTTTLGTATIGPSLDGRLIVAPSTSGHAVRGEYSALASASPYVFSAYLDAALPNTGGSAFCGTGIMISDGTQLSLFGPCIDTTGANICVFNYTSATALSAVATQVYATKLQGMPSWLRIRDDGANKYFEYSFNGVDWVALYTVSRTTFLTATAYGWAVNNNGTGQTAECRLRSLTLA